MSVKIGLISDIHATPAPVAEAMTLFKKQGVDDILCAGDIAGYGDNLEETIEILIQNKCKTIFGNHELWHSEKNTGADQNQINKYFAELPSVITLNIENKKLYMVHAHPPEFNRGGIKLLDEDGKVQQSEKQQWSQYLSGFEYDVLIVGHTHQVFSEIFNKTRVINPGSTKFNHSCAILTFPALSCDFYALSNISIIKSWNWGMLNNKKG